MIRVLVVAGAGLSLATRATAAPITFTATGVNPDGGASLSASAKFWYDSFAAKLKIQVTNTASSDVTRPSDVLTAIFFNITNNLNLSPISAILASGSTVLFDSAPSGGHVGGEFAYCNSTLSACNGMAGAPSGAKQGISSAGFGIFGNSNFSTKPDLDDPLAVDGINYGFTSAGDDPASGNAAVTGENPLIKNSVIFTFGGVPSNFDPSKTISNVSFQYGTDFSEPNIVAEPGSLLLLSSGLAFLIRSRGGARRRRHSAYDRPSDPTDLPA